MKADRRYWLTADGQRLVEDGDPDARSLFAAEGDEISAEDVKRFGLKAPKADADEKAAQPQPNKARGGAPENKGK